MRPRKLTPEIEARLDQIAWLKVDVPTYRELASETGLCPAYLRELISARVREFSDKRRESSRA